MLVDQNDTDILPRLCEVLKRLLDLSRLGLSVDDEEVPLGVRAGSHMLRPDVSVDILQIYFCSMFLSSGLRGVGVEESGAYTYAGEEEARDGVLR